MKLSISNIAWLKEEDPRVYELMKQYGFTGLDIAPARIFDSPFDITKEDAEIFKANMDHIGLEMVGMQSLLYGSKGLAIFEDEATRLATRNHLFKMIEYAAKIRVKILVFGSPKNRIIGNLDYEAAEEIAIRFFNEIGNYAKQYKVHFCVEPNPKEYGTDFLTNTIDAANFVRKVANEGFRLHVDLGTMIMNNENIFETMKNVIDVTKHVHISVPYLESVTAYKDHHIELAQALMALDYAGYASIEMKNSITKPNTITVEDALQSIAKIYGGKN